MTRSIINFLRAVVQWIWRRVSDPRVRQFILGIASLLFIIGLIMTGVTTVAIYFGMLWLLVGFGVASFWLPPLRSWFMLTLVVAALVFFGEHIIVDRVIPAVESGISSVFPVYGEWKDTRIARGNNTMAQDVIDSKKAITSSEVIKGTFGELTESSALYDDNGNPISGVTVEVEKKVMSMGLESKPQGQDSEGMLYIMVSNDHGDFVKGRTGYIPIRKVRWENQQPNASTTGPKTWEVVGDFPVPLSGNTFNRAPGAHGERVNTGEVYLYSLEQGYKYRFTLSGEYRKHGFFSWDTISWAGGQSGQNFRPPFPALKRGALALRVGTSEGLHPQTGDSFEYGIASAKEDAFAEVNLNREIGEYFDPSTQSTNAGGKLSSSTLSVKIERMPL